mmetsp:Transcript_68063/g.114045  ORF Transcript_68063/g.114045 Transcript_68063/m.114045 type:complete len:370 (-) Transcript_68063:965-2074(-)
MPRASHQIVRRLLQSATATLHMHQQQKSVALPIGARLRLMGAEGVGPWVTTTTAAAPISAAFQWNGPADLWKVLPHRLRLHVLPCRARVQPQGHRRVRTGRGRQPAAGLDGQLEEGTDVPSMVQAVQDLCHKLELLQILPLGVGEVDGAERGAVDIEGDLAGHGVAQRLELDQGHVVVAAVLREAQLGELPPRQHTVHAGRHVRDRGLHVHPLVELLPFIGPVLLQPQGLALLYDLHLGLRLCPQPLRHLLQRLNRVVLRHRPDGAPRERRVLRRHAGLVVAAVRVPLLLLRPDGKIPHGFVHFAPERALLLRRSGLLPHCLGQLRLKGRLGPGAQHVDPQPKEARQGRVQALGPLGHRQERHGRTLGL